MRRINIQGMKGLTAINGQKRPRKMRNYYA